MEVGQERIGTFFFLIGALMLVIFFGTDQEQNPQYLLFLIGAGLTAWGVFLLWRAYKPTPGTARFGMLRRMRQASKERKLKAEQKKLERQQKQLAKKQAKK